MAGLKTTRRISVARWARAIGLVAAALLAALLSSDCSAQSLASETADRTAAPAGSSGWSFPLTPAALTPRVERNGGPATLTDPTRTEGTLSWNARQGGEVVAIVRVAATSSARLDMTLSARTSGTFRYGLSVTVPRAHALDVDFTPMGPGSVAKYYPYNWTEAVDYRQRDSDTGIDPAHVAAINLVIPGFEADGIYYAEDTRRLTKLVFGSTGGAILIGLPKSREINVGHDAVSEDMPLAAGAADTLSLVAATSIDGLLRQRFGTPRPVSGRMTFLYNKQWPCDEPRCNIALADYESYAGALQGLYDIVITRSFEPHAEIARAFTSHGFAPYYYMFLAAERRAGRSFTDERWFLRDANSAEYVAPIVSVNGSWRLLDIRRPDVRAALVARALGALAMGYRGIFFDGPAFWVASDGYVGGSAAGAAESWAYARSQLLIETRAAMERAAPSARLGILGDRFYDAQYVGDLALKESYGERWIAVDPNPYERVLTNSPATNAAWDRSYRRYTRNTLFIGHKGANPLLIGSGHQWGRAPATTWSTEDGDVFPIDGTYTNSVTAIARILRGVSQYARTPRGTTITELEPSDATILTIGPSVIAVPRETSMTLSVPSPMLTLSTKTVTQGARLRTPAGRALHRRRTPRVRWLAVVRLRLRLSRRSGLRLRRRLFRPATGGRARQQAVVRFRHLARTALFPRSAGVQKYLRQPRRLFPPRQPARDRRNRCQRSHHAGEPDIDAGQAVCVDVADAAAIRNVSDRSGVRT